MTDNPWGGYVPGYCEGGMEDEDDVDILGEFNLENLLKNENQMFEDFEGVSSQWSLDADLQSILFQKDESQIVWTEKERSLLEKGLELFGQSWPRISRYVGTKTPQEVKSFVKRGTFSSDHVPASIEEVINVIRTARPTVRVFPKRKNSTKRKIGSRKVRGRSETNVVETRRSPEFAPETVVKIASYDPEDSDVDVEEEFAIRPEKGTILLPKPPQSDRPEVVPPARVDFRPIRSEPRRYSAQNTERLEAIHRLPKPIEEKKIGDEITEEEKEFHPEFFKRNKHLDRLRERYLRIRSHIIGVWDSSKPKYVTKTSVRPGLKNCGDVNLISRVHAYLEQVGAINFGCEQCHYSSSTDETRKVRERPIPEDLVLNTTRTRKRRTLSPVSGGGYTTVHGDSGATQATSAKRRRRDSIELVACRAFTRNKPAPYELDVSLSALLSALVHSHLSPRNEIMGLLGGFYYGGTMRVQNVVPCRASASSVHCDMCPVSQCEAVKTIESHGMTISGWYHSHPGGANDPSLRDLDTQSTMQSYFGRLSPFAALIVSPGMPSKFKFFTLEGIGDSQIAYELKPKISLGAFESEQVVYALREILDSNGLVPQDSLPQCLEDISEILGLVEPSLDPDERVGLYSRLEELLGGDSGLEWFSSATEMFF